MLILSLMALSALSVLPGSADGYVAEDGTQKTRLPTIRAATKGTMTTSMGEISFEIYDDLVPTTAENFEKYVNDGFYDGKTFHRVIDDFMIQGGHYYPDGSSDSPTYPPIPLEINQELRHIDGAMSMARTSDPNSAMNQFFICDGAQSFLDDDYAVFGQVTDGMDVVRSIAAVATDSNDKPTTPVVIQEVAFKANTAPAYTGSLSSATVDEDTTWDVDLSTQFTDPDGDALSFSCSAAEIQISGATASWTPSHGDVSLTDVVFNASDPNGLSAESPAIDLTYQEVNDAPYYISGLKSQQFPERTVWEKDLSSYFHDEENAPGMSYSCNKADITVTGSIASWAPPSPGVLEDVVFTATDGDDGSLKAESPAITLTCFDVNDPPRFLGGLEDQTAVEEQTWSIRLTDYFDDDENPGGMIFSCSHQEIGIDDKNASWTPDDGDGDLEDVIFTVTDGTDSKLTNQSDPITITFVAVNDPPGVSQCSTVNVMEDELYWLDLSFYVRDNDTELSELTVSSDSEGVKDIDGLKVLLTYGEGILEDSVELEITDGESSVTFCITVAITPVNDPPLAPVVTSIEDGDEFVEGEPFSLEIELEDPDNEESDLSVGYSSNLDGDIADPSQVTLSVGTHIITITVMDSDMSTNETIVNVTILPADDGSDDDGGDDNIMDDDEDDTDTETVTLSFGPVYFSDGKTPVEGATVTMTYDSGEQVTGVTGEDGTATINAVPGTGSATVVKEGETLVPDIKFYIDDTTTSQPVPRSNVEAPSSGTETDGSGSDGLNTSLVVAIILIVVIGVVLAVLVIMKKKKAPEAPASQSPFPQEMDMQGMSAGQGQGVYPDGYSPPSHSDPYRPQDQTWEVPGPDQSGYPAQGSQPQQVQDPQQPQQTQTSQTPAQPDGQYPQQAPQQQQPVAQQAPQSQQPQNQYPQHEPPIQQHPGQPETPHKQPVPQVQPQSQPQQQPGAHNPPQQQPRETAHQPPARKPPTMQRDQKDQQSQ